MRPGDQEMSPGEREGNPFNRAAAQVGTHAGGGRSVVRRGPLPPRIGWVYVWLFLVPVLGVPWLILNTFALPASASLGQWTVAVLAPAILFLPLFWHIRSDDLFRRRHTQQALILAALRIGSTWFWLAATRAEACGWIMTNLILWIGGSAWGLLQVQRRDCWLMRRRGEQQYLPRARWIASGKKDAAAAGVAASSSQTRSGPPSSSAPAGAGRLEAQLRRARSLAQSGQQERAVEVLLALYRSGAGAERRRAAAELERLGEIEIF